VSSRRFARLVGAWVALAFITPLVAEPATIGDARLAPVSFAELKGWAADDHASAFAVFRRSCAAIVADAQAARSAQPPSEDLRATCRIAVDIAPSSAKSFFEQHFQPFEVIPPAGRGFLTGYFEPEVEGALAPTDAFPTPLLARPDDLVTIPPGETWPGLEGLQAARRTASGFEPYPDRAAIEDGALGDLARPIVYLRHPVDAFIIHVQGSARIRLAERGVLRVAYAGKNGHPFTPIGRVLVERGHVPLVEMNHERLTGWLRDHPVEAQEIMRLNRSFIFFRRADELDPRDGPVGGAGLPLTPERSLAVDRNLWSYGLPFWLEGELPRPDGTADALARLMIAQDTGSAILGPARGDYFFGSGAAAGTRAGMLRHRARFVVLLPKPRAAP
jgi:membrane-bound lytic murein transglycosylase A